MVVVNCSVPNCNFKTDDVSEPLAIALLTNHALAHQLPPATDRPVTASQGPRLDRPKIEIGVSDEEWNVFVRRWTVFQTGSQIDIASAPAQLFQCAGPDLGTLSSSLTQKQHLFLLMISLSPCVLLPSFL